ncbi:YqcC family protein [Alkalimarinus coralli]|uniref:YqcC family protein n=1 Tax=Alkalimarinus coralli TaxID=2935863 RepID=UPI00202B16AE|nr:YqcC family protein [Alkalimarinus coralli]
MHSKIADLLLDIELEMRRLNIWSDLAPTQEQLMSTEPFCIDTMSFPEWIQFVFIERLKCIVEQGGTLPSNSDIAPMAEEYFRGSSLNATAFVALIRAFDQLIMAH